MRNTLLVLFHLLIMSSAAFAQHSDTMIFGDVKDKNSGEHLPFAIISVEGTNVKTSCDATGHFKLTGIPTGNYIVTARLTGYKSQQLAVQATDGTAQTLFFKLEEDALELNQVVVTATRTEHYVKNVPIRTEVLTAQAIESKNAKNLYEALEGVAGVRVEQQCQACNFSQVRMQGLGAEHTQVLIDGEPIYSGLAGVYGLQQIGTNDIDRIEIVKGAGSALYGSSAVAGSINIISREPTFEPSLNLDVEYGSCGHKNYGASAGMRKNNIGVSAFIQRNEEKPLDETQDGNTRKEVKHKDGISDRVESQMTNLGMGLYFFNPLKMGDKLILRGKVVDEQRRGGTMKDQVFLNPFSEGTEFINTNRFHLDLNYNLPLSSKTTLNLSTAYVHHKRNATNDTYLTSYKDSHNGESPDVEMMRPYLAKENSLTPSLTLTSRLGHHQITAGVQGFVTNLRETGKYCIDDEDNTAYYGTSYTSIGKKKAHEIGAFIQDEWTNLLPGLTIVPGIRLNTHHSEELYKSSEKVFDGNFPKTKFSKIVVLPRLALKFDVTKKLVLRANIGTGFRAPYGFSEDLHLCSGSPRIWKSSNLKGEKSISYNLSADYYADRLQLSLNIFRTDLKDKIEFASADANVKKLGYTYQWENVDDGYVQGIELGAKFVLLRDLKAGLNWTFNQGEYKHQRSDWQGTPYAKDSKQISRFPEMTGDLSLDYTPGTWTFTVESSLQGRMYIDYNAEDAANSKIKRTPTFMLLNARVSKKIGKMFTLYAGGKNILGYIQDEKHTDDAAFMYAPVTGAAFYAGVSLKL